MRSSARSAHGTGGAAHPPGGVEAVRQRARVEGHAAVLPGAGAAGPVHADAEQPGAQRRPTLEALDAAHDAQPGLLHDLVGDGSRGHQRLRQTDQLRVVAAHQGGERRLVTGAEGRDQRGVVHRVRTLGASRCRRPEP